MLPPSPRSLRRALSLGLLTTLAACTASSAVPAPSAGASAPSGAASPRPAPVASSTGPGSVAASASPRSASAVPEPAASLAPVESVDPSTIPALARAFLALDGLRLATRVEHARGDAAPEALVVGEGIVDPAGDRSIVTWDLSGLLGTAASSASPMPPFTVAWDATTAWVTADPAGAERRWRSASRAYLAEHGGLIGRLPAEPLALVRLLADAAPEAARRLPDAELDGRPAAVVRVSIPLADAVALGVPADTPSVAVVRQVYGLDALALDAWVRGGSIVRVSYTLVRAATTTGGEATTVVTYDWTPLGRPAGLRFPPAGRVEAVEE